MGGLVWTFCLILARVGTFIALVPLFGSHGLPRTIKAGLALTLTLVWFLPRVEALPATALFGSAAPVTWLGQGVALGREVFLGAVLGYGLGLFLVPVQVAGEYLTQEMGLSFGNQVNPTGDGSSSPLTQILELLAIAVFFGVDGHHVLLGVLHSTFTAYPVNGGLPQLPAPRLLAVVAVAEEWGLMLAAPVALLLFVTTVFLALLTRAAPQMNLYAVGFPLRLGVGLVAVLVLLPGFVGAMVSAFTRFGELVTQLM